MADSILDLSRTTTILRTKPNWSQTPERSFPMNRDEYQFNESPITLINISDYLVHLINYSFTFTNRSDYYSFVKFFSDRQGKLQRFWLPIYRTEFILSTDISQLDPSITIEDCRFTDIYQGYERLYIELITGDILTRKISGVVDNGDGTEELQLESVIDRDIASTEIKYLSRIMLVRFEIDGLQITHSTDIIAEADVRFRELVREYEE